MPLAAGGRRSRTSSSTSVDGRVELRERWRRGPLVVMFMRHFGCAFCREQLIKMGRAHADFAAAGAEVVAIFQYSAEATRDFCASRKVPFDCLGDPLREAYARGQRRPAARANRSTAGSSRARTFGAFREGSSRSARRRAATICSCRGRSWSARTGACASRTTR